MLRVVSVDDHLIEPPDLFIGRMPRRLVELAPRVLELDDGSQVWEIDGRQEPNIGLSAVVGRPASSWSRDPARFNEMRPGCWQIDERIKDMDLNGIAASLCFPSTLVGFCGSRLLQIRDDELALAVLRAWNEWHIEVWHGSYPDRIIPLQLPWLRDAELAAKEIRANAALGFRALSFCEDPSKLGLPSTWSDYWDPVFAACQETQTTMCVHVGSSRWHPTTAPEAPAAMRPVHFPTIALVGATELLWSGVASRFPDLKIVMSEGGVGWISMLAYRSDAVLHHSLAGEERKVWRDSLKPSEVLRRNFYFCAIDEPISREVVELMGIDHFMVEADYPHADGTWPSTQAIIESRISWMDERQKGAITYQNAERVFNFPIREAVWTALESPVSTA